MQEHKLYEQGKRDNGKRIDWAALPPCCGTGCAVCVLDYPELFAEQTSDESDTLALLEAIEQAQLAVTSERQ